MVQDKIYQEQKLSKSPPLEGAGGGQIPSFDL